MKSAKKAKGKSLEGGGTVTVHMPSDGSAYSDPSFVKDGTEALLLPVDRKRLAEIGLVQSAGWSLAHVYQVRILYVVFDVFVYLTLLVLVLIYL